MIKVGVKEAKNNLSRYLARVKKGEEVQITERGKPIARIIKEGTGSSSARKALLPLVDRGLVVLPSRGVNKENLSPLDAPGKPVSEMVIEDRR